MTMHLCPAFVTTTNHRKRKNKLNAKQLAAKAAHQKFVEKYTKGQKSDKKLVDKLFKMEYIENMKVERSAFGYTGMTRGVFAQPKEKVYTGDKLIGIATMHKSNMVPVFKAEDAADIANMRR
jgi:hypothetical protein